MSLVIARTASAQVTPAAGYTPPDDTPSIKVGATIFADYTFTQLPETPDGDGNLIHPNAFNLGRAYINITGNISHLVAYRITPDITRETGSGSTLAGSYTYRLKYAFAQINLDDWMSRGSWTRLGIQQTPFVDYEEGIYRYRFQGTVFAEREGFLSSADAGASFRFNFPQTYGDVHVGVYNGENYTRFEANDQKALEIRGTVRPFATASPVLRGLRITGFYVGDHYVKDAERTRFIANVTFEHQYLNAGFDYLDATDQTSATKAGVRAEGFSVWAVPKSRRGLEGLLRFDRLKPNDENDGERQRTIVGVAYWFPHQGSVSTSLLLDYEQATFDNFAPSQPKQQRIAVHGLVNF